MGGSQSTSGVKSRDTHVTVQCVPLSSASFRSFIITKFVETPDKWSFINWQMYMRSISWQAMLKVKKKSDKQWQRLDQVRKSDERATNEKEVQAKHALKNRAYRV